MSFEQYNSQVATQGKPSTPAAEFNQFLQKHKGQLSAALPKHMNADRMTRLALTAFSQNKDLAACDPKSIFASLIVASQLGLEPNVGGQCYLIPYNGKCTLVPGWKGLVDLVSRSGRATVWTGAVYEGDDFDYMLGDSPFCRHRPCGEFDENKLTHVYAIGRVKGSEVPVIEVWPIVKINAHFVKTVVKALQPKHYKHKHLEMYARKVALLQVLKYMPQSIELATAVDVAHASEEGRNLVIEGDFVVTDQGQPPEVDVTPAAQPAPASQPAPPTQQAESKPATAQPRRKAETPKPATEPAQLPLIDRLRKAPDQEELDLLSTEIEFLDEADRQDAWSAYQGRSDQLNK
ncbi:MAG: recombinase RecT [Pseudomonadota bacterium]|nr:recombinase RecT [Pseudomonadota bacterium]